MSNNKKSKETMTMAEVVVATGVTSRTIYKRIKSGEIKPLPKPPLLKKRVQILFYRADIEKLLGQ